MNSSKELRVYQTAEGKRPFDEWLQTLRDRKAAHVIRTRLDRLAYGLAGKCEPVGEGVFELKIYYGPGYRVYFGQEGASITLLILGGDKSRQVADIFKAKQYWRDYQGRK